MIALDTNILVYARREETVFHKQAKQLLEDLAEGDRPWALAWTCIYEFLRVITHPRVFDPPTDLETAVEDSRVSDGFAFAGDAGRRTRTSGRYASGANLRPRLGQSCP